MEKQHEISIHVGGSATKERPVSARIRWATGSSSRNSQCASRFGNGALNCTRPVVMARVGVGQGWWRRVSGRRRFAEDAAADPMQAKSDGLGGLDGCQRR
ncbi:hypothetical protein COCVIDRAFT_38666 [Bipolaris victoriae FI3]|uniref:Uncharacterized protein n=1 Tax=Bipolaris victoriae (strain FI3) TaxID=930091 RepID=W7EGZ0_BIPV3|nr:hypothetical protein COCVIDRAFT_38666 [Bipolaris victoriae FI3]